MSRERWATLSAPFTYLDVGLKVEDVGLFGFLVVGGVNVNMGKAWKAGGSTCVCFHRSTSGLEAVYSSQVFAES